MKRFYRDIDQLLEATKESDTKGQEQLRLFHIDIDALLEATQDLIKS